MKIASRLLLPLQQRRVNPSRIAFRPSGFLEQPRTVPLNVLAPRKYFSKQRPHHLVELEQHIMAKIERKDGLKSLMAEITQHLTDETFERDAFV